MGVATYMGLLFIKNNKEEAKKRISVIINLMLLYN